MHVKFCQPAKVRMMRKQIRFRETAIWNSTLISPSFGEDHLDVEGMESFILLQRWKVESSRSTSGMVAATAG